MAEQIQPLGDKGLVRFQTWLVERGAELLATTNPYEVLRFKAGDETHVIYRREKGEMLSAAAHTAHIVRSHRQGGSWRAPIQRTNYRAGLSEKAYLALIKRDGDGCFFCGDPVSPQNATIEHLVARSLGGPNHQANLALAHFNCNGAAGNLSVVEKVRLRERIRAAKREAA